MKSVSPGSARSSLWEMRERTTLHSVDPAGNRFRFFIVEVWLPPVGTGAALRKRWGRIGTEGRSDVLYFDGPDGAQHYAEVLIRRRLKRGYVEVESEEWKLLALEAEMEARLARVRTKLGRVREHMRAATLEEQQLALWADPTHDAKAIRSVG